LVNCRCRRAVQQSQLRSADNKQTVLEVMRWSESECAINWVATARSISLDRKLKL